MVEYRVVDLSFHRRNRMYASTDIDHGHCTHSTIDEPDVCTNFNDGTVPRAEHIDSMLRKEQHRHLLMVR